MSIISLHAPPPHPSRTHSHTHTHPSKHTVYWGSTLLYHGISLLTCRIRIIWSSGKSLFVGPGAKAVGTLWSLPISTGAVPLFHCKQNVINFHKLFKWSRHLWMYIFKGKCRKLLPYAEIMTVLYMLWETYSTEWRTSALLLLCRPWAEWAELVLFVREFWRHFKTY